MASTNGEADRPIRVEQQPRAQRQLEGLRDLALARRVALSFAEDLRTVLGRLKTDPVGWGDSLNDYKSLGMIRRRGQSVFVYVDYTYHPGLRTVTVQGWQVNPYGPLGG